MGSWSPNGMVFEFGWGMGGGKDAIFATYREINKINTYTNILGVSFSWLKKALPI